MVNTVDHSDLVFSIRVPKVLKLYVQVSHIKTVNHTIIEVRFIESIALAAVTAATPLEVRQSTNNTAVLDLAIWRGTSQQLASGIIYGTPDTANKIPDSFCTGPKIKYFRAGGAQLFAPGQRCWHWSEYQARFNSTLSNYRKYGGEFQIPLMIFGALILPTHLLFGQAMAVTGQTTVLSSIA
jgi:hypothetical protein